MKNASSSIGMALLFIGMLGLMHCASEPSAALESAEQQQVRPPQPPSPEPPPRPTPIPAPGPTDTGDPPPRPAPQSK